MAAAVFLIPTLPGQTCSETNAAGCTVINATGDVANTLPKVHCQYAVAYSTLIDAAAEKLMVCYPASAAVSNTQVGMIVLWHGGGGTSGAYATAIWNTATSVDIMALVERTGRVVFSVEYTLNTGTSPSVALRQLQEGSCALHYIAHNVGTLFPGNINDTLNLGASWGNYFGNVFWYAFGNASIYTDNCEVSDTFPGFVRPPVEMGPVYDWITQYGLCSGGGGSGCDIFKGAINCANPCNTIASTQTCASSGTPTAGACSSANGGWAKWSPRTYVNYAKAPPFVMHGAGDQITNSTWQGIELQSDYASNGVAAQLFMVPSIVGVNGGHSLDWQNAGSFWSLPVNSQTYNQVVNYLVNQGGVAAASGIGSGIGGM